MRLLFVLFTSLLIGLEAFAMNNFECQLNFKFERQKSDQENKEANPNNQYLFAGSGEVACKNESPFTVYAAFRLNETNQLGPNVKAFNMKIETVQLNSFTFLFQTYKLSYENQSSSYQLNFQGNENFPALKLNTLFSSPDFTNESLTSDFLKSLTGSSVIIEQDPFYPYYN